MPKLSHSLAWIRQAKNITQPIKTDMTIIPPGESPLAIHRRRQQPFYFRSEANEKLFLPENSQNNI